MADNIFRETFESPYWHSTKAAAEKNLEDIRRDHPATSGWTEEIGYIEIRNGKFRAVRKHSKPLDRPPVPRITYGAR